MAKCVVAAWALLRRGSPREFAGNSILIYFMWWVTLRLNSNFNQFDYGKFFARFKIV